MARKKRKYNLHLKILISCIILTLILLVGIGIYIGMNGIPEKQSGGSPVEKEAQQAESTAGADSAESTAENGSTAGKEAEGGDDTGSGNNTGSEAYVSGDEAGDASESGTERESIDQADSGSSSAETGSFDLYKEEEAVEALQAIYNSRSPLYVQENRVTAETTGVITSYSLDGEIIEIAAVYETETYHFYYDQGELYYAQLGWSNTVVGTSDANELYYQDGNLIRWVDSDGDIHELEDSEAYRFWSDDQVWAAELYTKVSSGSLTGAETAPTALSATLAFEDPATAGMIFPDSDSRYLTDTEVSGLTSNQIQYAIDEIYARRGYNLGDNEYGHYYSQFEWYQPVVGSANDIVGLFNEYESYNVNLLVSYQ